MIEQVPAIRFKIVRDYGYLNSMVYTLQPIEKEIPYGYMSVDAAARWYWNIKKLKGVPLDELCAATIHEMFHLMLNHFVRGEHLTVIGKDGIPLVNIAGDLAINCMFQPYNPTGFKFPLPKDCLHPYQYGFPNDLMMEEYYKLLLEKEEKGDGEGGTEGTEGNNTGDNPKEGGEGTTESNKQGVAKGHCGSCAGKAGDHSYEENGGQPDPEDKDKPGTNAIDLERIRKQVAEEIKAEAAKGMGNVPGGLVRWAKDYLKARVNWRQELRHAVRSAINAVKGQQDYSFKKMNKHQASYGDEVILPGMISPKILVGVLMDTSASLSSKMLEQGKGEVLGILKKTNCDIILVSCDAVVQDTRKVKGKKDIVFSGGGGTNLVVGYAALVSMKPKPQIIIIITDCETPWPTKQAKGTRTIIVDTNKRQNEYTNKRIPTWAKVFHINAKDDE